MRLQQKVVLVTGSGAGIGKSIAELFAKEGAKVIVNDINLNSGRSVADAIRQAGGVADFIGGDISKEADVENMVKKTVETYGKLDILVNNAGVDQPIKVVHEFAEEEWDRVLNVNLKGVYFMCKHAIVQMIAHGGGTIVNIASMSGLLGQPLNGVYCASKGGVIQLTRSLALECRAANIRVNAICPGLINTELGLLYVKRYSDLGIPFEQMVMARQGRYGKAEEIAFAALFLACDESSFINGIALPVDGGVSAS